MCLDGFSRWYLLVCNKQGPLYHEGAGQREERAPGALPLQFNALALMWTPLLPMARTGPRAHPAAGWPSPSPSPCLERGESKGHGAKTSEDGQQGVRCGGKALEGSVTGGGCAGENMQSERRGLRGPDSATGNGDLKCARGGRPRGPEIPCGLGREGEDDYHGDCS